ncbi:MAG: hypothetical protein MUC71_03235 [Steroidobacteraceae bacterium]|nr:hypothetical protein [Steroidobacteraceae bacterium]
MSGPTGWCSSCRRRVKSGGVPGLYVMPGGAARVLYLLCPTCFRHVGDNPLILERVEDRVLELLPVGGVA